jgi:predicted RecB family nuclease
LALRPDIRAPQTGQKRRGRGFTKQELRDAGITITDARWMAIPIDTRRSTSYPENVEILKEYMKRISKLGKAEKPKPKPKAKPAKVKPAKPVPVEVETDLTDLSGITKKLAETLVSADVTSISALASSPARRLTRITGLKRERVDKMIEAAKRHIREESRTKREEKAKEPQVTELKHLPEITRADIRKLKELGVESLESLKNENSHDLSLLTGIPESRIKNWVKLIRNL